METLVLPPQDQLVRRHYWHNNIKKTGEFYSLSVIPSRSRRRSSANAFFHSPKNQTDPHRTHSRNSNVNQGAVAPSNGLDGLLANPGCSIPDNVTSRIPSPSVLRSVGSSSPSLQPSDCVLRTGGSAISSRLFISEAETSSGRNTSQLKHQRIDRTVQSLPEQVVLKFANGKGLANNTNSKQRKSPNFLAVESAERKVYKEKKTVKKIDADKGFSAASVFQGKSPDNVPSQITILQRPESREEALRNLAIFKGVPLSECAENGLLMPSNREDAISKSCPEFDILSTKGNATNDTSVYGGDYDSVVSTPKGNKLSRRHSSFERKKDLDLFSPDFKMPNSSTSEVGIRMTAPNRLYKSSSEEMYPVGETDLANDQFSNSQPWTFEILAEKWAGPSYSASPPPSSLPLPKFFLQRQSSSTLEVGAGDRTEGFSAKSSTSLCVGRVQEFSKSCAPVANYVEMDTELATKDLRRMLHLDF